MAAANLSRQQLVTAAIANDTELLQDVIKEYPTEVDTLQQGVGALHEAARHGHLQVIKILAHNYADLNLCDPHDNTPLHFAVMGKHPDAVELLIKLGADIYEVNLSGKSAAMLAFENNYSECIQKFLQKDEHVRLKDERSSVTLSVSDDACEGEEASMEIAVDRCVFCKDRPGIMHAEPCGHKFCFLCSLKNDACKECGTVIQKIYYVKTDEVTDYIREVENSDNKIQELEMMHKCPICYYKPIDCMLWCGHMYCLDCVHKSKNYRRESPDDGPFKCAFCSGTSRYKRLFTKWQDDELHSTWKNKKEHQT